MERQLKDTATTAGLNFSDLSAEGVASAAIELAAAAKQLGLSQSAASQLPFFILHLACLEKGFQINPTLLQKKSALAPRDYYRNLATYARILSANTASRSLQITGLSLSRFYRTPSLRDLLHEHEKEGVVGLVAACYLIGQTACPKWKIGSVMDLGQLWAIPAADLKAACVRLQTAIRAQISEPKKLGALLAQESSKTTEETRHGISENCSTAEAQSSNSSPFAHTTHPMCMFSCAGIGPAFGPLLIQ